MSRTTLSQTLLDNRILACLPAGERERLRPHAEFVDFFYQQTVYEHGDPVRHVYFPAGCVVPSVAIMNDGTTVETSMVGREGAVGATAVFGEYRSREWMRVLIPGPALMFSADVLGDLFRESESLQSLLLLHYRTRINHVSRRVVCNSRHRLFERVCAWLLMVHDRVGGDRLALTQEAIARQLGARRAGVNEVMGALQRVGIIGHSRGHIEIKDREGLEAVACACYCALREEMEWFKAVPWGAPLAGGVGGRGGGVLADAEEPARAAVDGQDAVVAVDDDHAERQVPQPQLVEAPQV
jgi:CRP-like cAMP-binding protein